MINAPQLLADLTKLLKRLEGDLLQRIEEVPDLKSSLQAEWQAARDAGRCAETFETWTDQVITQAGVHWLLSCVFLRFIEDNQLVDRPWLGGTPESERLALARDRHEAYFQNHPLENDRDYLSSAFREAGTLPGLHTFFDEAHNPVFRLGISGDAAMALRQFWQQVDPNTGALLHDFSDPSWNTRFLGDLYQDLSEATRKRYALLQTPEFVEEFILDRTLTPAIHEFGFREVRMIDPTCGSGHFLLGGFHRLLAEWQRNEPARTPVDMAQKALDGVAGVDLNPFAVAISRFRLFVAALQASGVHRLANAHDFKVSVAIGDSLLHGTRFGLTQSQDLFDVAESHADTGLAHAYASEDLTEVQRILGRQYHAVVGNPPYIVVKDAALNAAYRRQYASCHRQYSLGAPFTERFFELAVTGAGSRRAGYAGLITANSFIKREFGSKLIEQVLPRLDLTHVVDTSGAYIPGHGTPTVILFGRHRAPVAEDVRTVMGIKGEPSTPVDPALGLVWSAITGQIDRVGSESDFVSVADTPRATLARHPWSIGGGGATDLSDAIEQASSQRLSHISDVFSGTGRTSADDVLVAPAAAFARSCTASQDVWPLVEGDQVRDWDIAVRDSILRAVIVDELHAFAADDRGWHMRSVLHRLDHYLDQPLQRIGLSATVSNPTELLDWFAPSGERCVVGRASVSTDADVTIDHVGTLENAATVISRLHRGEKRLVFCDSRSSAEQLSSMLRARQVRTFVSHASLSASERRQAEAAFGEEKDCVIVATSTLELGIDVGDLDRVIQIDSPSTVSSFLQRMGRTGRREGSRRSCLFLTTNQDAFMLALGVTHRWSQAWVEAAQPPEEPWPITSQQILAATLERGEWPLNEVAALMKGCFPELPSEGFSLLIDHMVQQAYLDTENGLVRIGPRAEREFGRGHYRELLASFSGAQLLTGRYGSAEVGYIDPTVLTGDDRQRLILLAGRSWLVKEIEWSKRTVWMEPAKEGGKARWTGGARSLSRAVCQGIRAALADGLSPTVQLSMRAKTELAALVEELAISADARFMFRSEGADTRTWTFAGTKENRTLARAAANGGAHVKFDALSVHAPTEALASALCRDTTLQLTTEEQRNYAEGVKFASAVPSELLCRTILARNFSIPEPRVPEAP